LLHTCAAHHAFLQVADTEKKLTKEIEILKAKEKRAADAAEAASAQVTRFFHERCCRALKYKTLLACIAFQHLLLTSMFAQVVELEKAAKVAASELEKANKELAEVKVAAGEGEKSRAAAAALGAELGELKGKFVEVEAGYKKEMTLRKKYYNIIEDMKGKIRVYCRVRPFNKMEREKGSVYATFFPDDMTIDVQTSRDRKSFTFDQCFQSNSTQEAVFEDTQNLIQSAMDGYNVCIFAYGQTGAGKTHTMYGNPEMPGIAPRAMSELFRLVEENRGTFETRVRCYMVELYNDGLVDLLKGKKDEEKPLAIKQDAKGIVFVQGATIQECATLDDLIRFQQYGDSQRHVAATAMNAVSSRSHLIFSILVEAKNVTTGVASVGKLTLVDLAGSERAGKTGATGDRLKEAQSINMSLSALGDVIGCLSSGEKFVPYRNNKLTMLLQVCFLFPHACLAMSCCCRRMGWVATPKRLCL
jgi:hypothetical protein